ncbi:diacylglycerol/lipid kinase family protein [Pedobacter chitinilyticus]|uniref:YegS/Rv2252/BmrU family lipid kinase n=1 Tax=Pedobacter chitinilyticus TaxID=2233776 RepID=A0A443YNQ9_9SPHI|nr:YegS/Rv2252/BmrU family lipid kinase [Pedobacter chitinilyticus]RWU05422.1 YegS/Rv2252/BmrU family lipid kinase [Pedobacter chitinilyticus]
MTYKNKKQRLLFVVNQGSGNRDESLSEKIINHFADSETSIEIFELPRKCDIEQIKKAIAKAKADRVVAVGGDGTLKLVAECLLNTETPIGIIPAGSANGMAKDLDIPLDIEEALEVAAYGTPKKIHATLVNDELCIHLSDIGFNAYLVKKFDELPTRGMLTYAKSAWHAFWNHKKMQVQFKVGKREIKTSAAMVVIANATKYGTGFEINPDGKLDDDVFEVILIKEYAVMEILKIWISKLPWNPKKIESFQASEVKISTKYQAHFQVDGEYMGKTNKVEAKILPNAINIIMP